MSRKPYCSFCGTSEDDCKALIEGAAICICDECVGLCEDILVQQGVRIPDTNQSEKPVTEPTQTAVLNFLNDLRDPEALGHAVTIEVRQKARDLVRQILREMDKP